jgi:hypothetical protein
VRGRAPRVKDWRTLMVDRQSFGDLVLAIALVLPTAAIAKSESAAPQTVVASSAAIAKAAIVDRTMSERGVSFLG